MPIVFERFPELTVDGHQLVWDSRQKVTGKKAIVFLFDEHTPEARSDLLGRPGAIDVHDWLRQSSPDNKSGQLSSRRALAELAAQATEFSSERLKLFAVTGTNGKSTTNGLVAQLLQNMGLGPTAELGTLGLRLYATPSSTTPTQVIETGFTSPESPSMHALCLSLANAGYKNLCFEASSHAMALDRCAGLDIDVAAFTNITLDHLDFHKTFERYRSAKLKLFTDYLKADYVSAPQARRSKKSKSAVTHIGGPDGQLFAQSLGHHVNAQSFALGQNLFVLDSSINGMTLKLNDHISPTTSLVGSHNAENLALAFLSVNALTQKPLADIMLHAPHLEAPAGRLQRVADMSSKNRRVFVDYAHTPDALQRALQTLQDLKPKGARLSVVFGCGGDRDRSKRPMMGQIAASMADSVIVTSDNPRSESPLAIAQEITQGLSNTNVVVVIIDRAEAIRVGIQNLRAGDLLLIAGKGHENYQIIGSTKLHFSDVEQAQKALNGT